MTAGVICLLFFMAKQSFARGRNVLAMGIFTLHWGIISRTGRRGVRNDV